jgi:ankyrin repeat protein
MDRATAKMLKEWHKEQKTFFARIWSAAARGDTTTMLSLISRLNRTKYVEVNNPDLRRLGRSLLHAAAMGGYTDTVRALVKCGAELGSIEDNKDVGDGEDKIPVWWAARKGHTSTVEALVRGGDAINRPNNYGETALHAAAMGGHTATYFMLVHCGADVNATDKNGRTPLDAATARGRKLCTLLTGEPPQGSGCQLW